VCRCTRQKAADAPQGTSDPVDAEAAARAALGWVGTAALKRRDGRVEAPVLSPAR
jgi:hypothetical protein